ncbi:hypothetical protein GCM10010080_30110 [Thermomonas carbonis]|nr:hypothetical protein GCM10010080_30110 [Thermomonas carbonis]
MQPTPSTLSQLSWVAAVMEYRNYQKLVPTNAENERKGKLPKQEAAATASHVSECFWIAGCR